MQLSAIILAGGKSSRMGEDKGLLNLNGSAMITHVINTLKEITDDVFIVSNNNEYGKFGLPVYRDLITNKGPIAGIYTGLLNSASEVNIIVSCDSPFVSIDFLKNLMLRSITFDVTIPSYNDRIHPTIGIYNRSIIEILKQQIDSNELKLMLAIEKVKHQIIKFSSIDKDIDPKIFSNINTKQDLSKHQK